MKEDFKNFVKVNPRLINYVKDNNAKWQDLYEIYALYGEDEKVWNKYVNSKSSMVDDLFDIFKGINLESIRKTSEGLQKLINLMQDLTKNNNEEIYEKEEYDDINEE